MLQEQLDEVRRLRMAAMDAKQRLSTALRPTTAPPLSQTPQKDASPSALRRIRSRPSNDGADEPEDDNLRI
jgi:hypothetical protein